VFVGKVGELKDKTSFEEKLRLIGEDEDFLVQHTEFCLEIDCLRSTYQRFMKDRKERDLAKKTVITSAGMIA
jgi:hypothetical protein